MEMLLAVTGLEARFGEGKKSKELLSFRSFVD
jgi:hypothetical protein